MFKTLSMLFHIGLTYLCALKNTFAPIQPTEIAMVALESVGTDKRANSAMIYSRWSFWLTVNWRIVGSATVALLTSGDAKLCDNFKRQEHSQTDKQVNFKSTDLLILNVTSLSFYFLVFNFNLRSADLIFNWLSFHFS